MRRVLVLLAIMMLGGLAMAQGFAIRGAFPFNLGSSQLGFEGELEYNSKLDANLTWGVKVSAQKIPLDGGDLVLILPGGFLEYRFNLMSQTSAYAKAELGIGLSPQFFPRLVLTGGLDSRYQVSGLEVFGQTSAYFDFIVTNRAKLGVTGRFGAIAIPFVPYVAADLNYNFYPAVLVPKLFAGSLLFLSPHLFLGLEGGIDTNGFVRLFFQFSQ